jgi:hypothetical protein
VPAHGAWGTALTDGIPTAVPLRAAA